MSPQLVLGPSGVLQGIRPGKCYVDMSTVDADTVTELAQVVALFGLALQHPFGWSPKPRLTTPRCYCRAKAREERHYPAEMGIRSCSCQPHNEKQSRLPAQPFWFKHYLHLILAEYSSSMSCWAQVRE